MIHQTYLGHFKISLFKHKVVINLTITWTFVKDTATTIDTLTLKENDATETGVC